MPGLLGFISDNHSFTQETLQLMIGALQESNRFRVEQTWEPGAGFAALTLSEPQSQPNMMWSRDQSRLLLLHGRLFDYEHLKRDLENKGYDFKYHSDSEFLLHFTEAYGLDRLADLNGIFAIAIWNKAEQELALISDRLGLDPLYYTKVQNGIVFASGVRSILAHPSVEKNVDKLAIGEYLTFDHLLHRRTLVDGVTLVPQGAVLRYGDGHSTVRHYWQPLPQQTYELRSEEQWLNGLHEQLAAAIKRQVTTDVHAGILLSGGLDSRVIAAFAQEIGESGIRHSFTFGIPGCDDQRFAAEVAQALDLEHRFFQLKPDWLISHADECVRATDGMGNLVNLHARAPMEPISQLTGILYKGFLGDAMAGFAQRHQHWSSYTPPDALQAHLQVHREQGVIIYEPSNHDALFTPEFRRTLGTHVLDSYRCGMLNANTNSLADQRIYFDYTQRVPRHTLNGVQVVRNWAEVRLPFADKDLLDYMISVPPGLRYKRRIMKDAFLRAFPKLAQIPNPSTGLPLTDCARDVSIRFQRLLRWHLHKRGLYAGDYLQRRPYKDYSTWFRTVLRSWVEDNLLSKKALERGYFEADYVAKMVREHMTGTTNHAARLGLLLTIELWHQQFVDR